MDHEKMKCFPHPYVYAYIHIYVLVYAYGFLCVCIYEWFSTEVPRDPLRGSTIQKPLLWQQQQPDKTASYTGLWYPVV